MYLQCESLSPLQSAGCLSRLRRAGRIWSLPGQGTTSAGVALGLHTVGKLPFGTPARPSGTWGQPSSWTDLVVQGARGPERSEENVSGLTSLASKEDSAGLLGATGGWFWK